LAPKGYPVVAINPNDAAQQAEDSFDNMVKRAKEKKYPFAYLHDETQAVAKAYGAARTPHIWVLKKESGKLKVAYVGAIDNNAQDAAKADKKYVEEAVAELIAGKTVTTGQTKAVGCTIKWKSEN
jgi:hypothetical protein